MKLFKIFIFCLILFSTGCSLLKARPALTTTFLPYPQLLTEQRNRAPFHGYWVFDPEKFPILKNQTKKVYIAPININFIKQQIKAARGDQETKIVRIQEARELANYFEAILKLKLRELSNDSLEILDKYEKGAIHIKLAMTNLIPTNPGINFAGTVAGFLFPGGGLVRQFGEGSIAMEGYLQKITRQKDIYQQFKDRELQKSAPFTLKDYQRYAHLRVIVDDWATQISELYITDENHTVPEANLFLLSPL